MEKITDKEETEEVVQFLLERARTRIAAGDRDQALASLLHAISLTRGEGAVMGVLAEAKAKAEQERICREESEEKLQRLQQHALLEEALRASDRLVQEASMLAERGDGSENILVDAFEDGSSVICQLCGGLVKRVRWNEHHTKWCPNIVVDENIHDDDCDMDV